ncbi:MAG: RagB/SusD family nutrient uptake outer membrane protein [Bacteroidetes bacterium]|uniref:RagB/SusD family nutrient uptake outer membrane protein n=1 Tax=Candidatus Cryptobacteroides merdavium TaxID=2840769 RepID=A0A9D9EFP1_9BACT|nr:RagB/SusD family nutrient uptake outer membrane protein [Candidatus Cryptobacteroides merdavium]
MNIIRKIFVSAGIIAGLSLVSCDLTTESQSTFDETSVFSDPTLTAYQIYSIYEVFGHTNSHRGRYLPWYGYNTDIEWYISNTRDEKSQIVRYNMLSTNSQLNVSDGPYNELFAGIERANLSISGIREYGSPSTRPEMAALLGEALTMRAVLYTELLKAYGEVPARFAPVTPETIYLNKSDRDVIYKQILADLEESFDYLTYTTATSTDRVGLAFTKGMYARIALMASGYALRPDKGTVGTGNAGTIRLSDDPELSKSVLYPKALAALRDVISNSGLELEPDYEALWKSVNNMELTAGHEIIWVIPFSNSRGRWNYTFAVRNNGYTTYSPTTSDRGGQAGPVPYVYYWYDENDSRRDVSCVNFEWEDKGDGTLPYPAGIANWYFGKYRFEWMTSSPYSGGNDDGVKPVYMRYADILLMAAELANSSENPDRDEAYAKSCLREVLRRAYRGHESEADAIVDGLSGEEAIFNEIKKQRALEFVGEFLRKADLIRWNCLKSSMDNAATELNTLRNGGRGTITGRDYSLLGHYLWYRHGTENGIPTIEMYGIHLGENEADETTPPAGSGWIPYLNSSGATTEYIDTDSFTSTDTQLDKATPDGFYNADPNLQQWWPIPEVAIINAQGSLKNDYTQY